MTKRRERSKFWVVTTHVLTTGFAFPFVASLVGAFLMAYMAGAGGTPEPALPEVLPFLVFLAILAGGYLGGTVYSLSWLRKVAVVSEPTACTTPSVILFAVLSFLGFLVNAHRVQFALLAVLGLCVYHAVIIVGFAGLTARGFRRMEGAVGADTTSKNAPPSEAS